MRARGKWLAGIEGKWFTPTPDPTENSVLSEQERGLLGGDYSIDPKEYSPATCKDYFDL